MYDLDHNYTRYVICIMFVGARRIVIIAGTEHDPVAGSCDTVQLHKVGRKGFLTSSAILFLEVLDS
jgi:hypothetical protein